MKPTVGKIILFLILMAGINYFFIPNYVSHGGVLGGTPLKFWPVGTGVEFLWLNFIIDIVFWYLASATIIWIFNKVKR
ncbi:MAG: hypothetical protein HYW24_03430 [Candidatus Aenigmarchaeota archaeon]|nr:hypothetical protein [Candidatus Aenigmarchaeota archaeon]